MSDDSQRFTYTLSTLTANTHSAQLAALDVLLADLASSALRDLEPDAAMLGALLSLAAKAWETFLLDAQCKVHKGNFRGSINGWEGGERVGTIFFGRRKGPGV